MKKLFFLIVFLSFFSVLFSQNTVVINEFLSKNTLGPVDNAGELEDWIELYNYGLDTVNVAGFYISDKLNDPTQWQIPTGNDSTKIAPGGFLLLWADEDLTQGVLHVDFKLSNSGEAIGLMSPAQVWVDSLSFGAQTDDVSFGRQTDGSATWQFFTTTTPGASNNPSFLYVSSNLLNYSSTGSGPADVTINSNVNWSISCAESWVGFSPSTGSGNSAINLIISANTNTSARTATLEIAGTGVPLQSVSINQLGNTPTLVVSTTLLSLNSPEGSEAGFNILSNINWTISCPDSWLDISPASGTDNADIIISANTENPQNSPRSTILTISGPGVSDKQIDVTQAGTPIVPLLFINEILPSSTTILDNYGEVEDFIEIYNPGNQAVDLAGLYLTDDAANLMKWQIPSGNDSTIVQPGGWLVFWADEDTNQGVLHTNFKLSASGEFAGLLVNEFYPVDTLTYPDFSSYPADATWGRMPDGGYWTGCMATPGEQNIGLEAFDNENLIEMEIYPNPGNNQFTVETPSIIPFNLRLSDITGREVLKLTNYVSGKPVDVSFLKPGIYFICMGFQSKYTKWIKL